MKTKIISILVALITIFTFTACGSSSTEDAESTAKETTAAEDYDGYSYGYFEKYNSYAKDNGLGDTPIYIKGTVKSVFDFKNMCNLSVESEDGGKWLITFIDAPYSDKANGLFDGQEITCFGKYTGYSDIFLMPSIFIDYIMIGVTSYTSYDIVEETTIELTTEVQVETEETTTQKQSGTEDSFTKLYSDDNITLYYCSTEKYKYKDNKAVVNFFVENNTDKTLSIISGLIVLDGISYNKSAMSDDVAANSKGYIDATIENTTNFSPKSIGLVFSYGVNISDRTEVEVKETSVE